MTTMMTDDGRQVMAWTFGK